MFHYKNEPKQTISNTICQQFFITSLFPRGENLTEWVLGETGKGTSQQYIYLNQDIGYFNSLYI